MGGKSQSSPNVQMFGITLSLLKCVGVPISNRHGITSKNQVQRVIFWEQIPYLVLFLAEMN